MERGRDKEGAVRHHACHDGWLTPPQLLAAGHGGDACLPWGRKGLARQRGHDRNLQGNRGGDKEAIAGHPARRAGWQAVRPSGQEAGGWE